VVALVLDPGGPQKVGEGETLAPQHG
jgi:hypothetical protein